MTPDAARALRGVAALLDTVVVDHPELSDSDRLQLQLAFEILTGLQTDHGFLVGITNKPWSVPVCHPLIAAPHLFIKPRSFAVDGVKAGYKKEPDTIDWSDDGEVIARIKSLRPDLAPLLIRTQESLNIDALSGCAQDDLRMFGVRTIGGADRRYIVIGDNDVERLMKIVIADAMRRQGEDEAQPKAKGKARAKAAEGV